MNNKTLLLSAFIIMALVQLYVPAQMIWSKETTLSQGRDFKFKTTPVDPNDPFRGKYIRLRFDVEQYTINDFKQLKEGQDIYVYLETDALGFAKIETVNPVKIGNSPDFIIAGLRSIDRQDSTIQISYPFDRFYMEESKAYDAELAYNESLSDSSNVTYALVSVQNGEAVLKDVLINDISIRQVAASRKE